MSRRERLRDLLTTRHDLLGGLSLVPFLMVLLAAGAVGIAIPFGPLVQWELGELVDVGNAWQHFVTYYLAGAPGIVLMGASMVKPLWGLFFWAIALPFRGTDYVLISAGGADVRIQDFFMVPALFGWLVNRLYVRRVDLQFERMEIERPAAFLIWWSFLSYSWAMSWSGPVSKLIQMMYAVFIVLMYTDLIRTKMEFRWQLFGWTIGGFMLAGMALLEAAAAAGQRAESAQTSSLETAEYLDYSILMTFALIMVVRNYWYKGVLVVAFYALLLGHLATGSRGPLLGLAVAFLFLVIFSPEWRNYFLSVGLIGLIGILSLIGILAIANYAHMSDVIVAPVSRVLETFQSTGKPDVGEMYRYYIWLGILQLFKQHPILGIGVGSLPDILPFYVPDVFVDPKLAHDIYFEVFIALGPIGFAFFLWFVVRLLVVCYRMMQVVDDEYRIIGLGLIGSLIAEAIGGLTFGLFYENRVMWSCIGLTLGHYMVTRPKPLPREEPDTAPARAAA